MMSFTTLTSPAPITPPTKPSSSPTCVSFACPVLEPAAGRDTLQSGIKPDIEALIYVTERRVTFYSNTLQLMWQDDAKFS